MEKTKCILKPWTILKDRTTHSSCLQPEKTKGERIRDLKKKNKRKEEQNNLWGKKNSLNEKQLNDTELLWSTICEHGLTLQQQQAEDEMTREGEEEEEKKLTGAGVGNLKDEKEKLVATPMFLRNGHSSTPSLILSS
jgi:coproporphyrinogen III oxidase-like Fe-S oxidoreductase